MKSLRTTVTAIGLSIVPVALAAQELFSVAHPTVTGGSVSNVYSYLPAEQAKRTHALFPDDVVFRPGIVKAAEIVDGIDLIFHPGAVLVVDLKVAEHIRDKLAAIGTPDALTITQIAE